MKFSFSILFKLLFFLIGVLLLKGCSSDNGQGEAIPKKTAVNYLPMEIGNEWIYSNHRSANDNQESQNEFLRINDTLQKHETTGYSFFSSSELENQGVMTSLLTHGYLNSVRGKLVFNGDFIFAAPLLGDSIHLPAENLILLNQNVDAGDDIGQIQYSQKNKINYADSSVLVTFNYTLKTVQGGYVLDNDLKEKGFDHSEALSSYFILEANATAQISEEEVELFKNQEIIHSKFYFVEEVGMILSETDINVKYEDLSDYAFPETNDIQGTSGQKLLGYTIK